mmetsp:Transcript_21551/g.73088  ORF Transcript_21551/g.73088 Transcript_21551/m.73088 type:complete len:222 (-) Transcript_21551:168-833(-)
MPSSGAAFDASSSRPRSSTTERCATAVAAVTPPPASASTSARASECTSAHASGCRASDFRAPALAACCAAVRASAARGSSAAGASSSSLPPSPSSLPPTSSFEDCGAVVGSTICSVVSSHPEASSSSPEGASIRPLAVPAATSAGAALGTGAVSASDGAPLCASHHVVDARTKSSRDTLPPSDPRSFSHSAFDGASSCASRARHSSSLDSRSAAPRASSSL